MIRTLSEFLTSYFKIYFRIFLLVLVVIFLPAPHLFIFNTKIFVYIAIVASLASSTISMIWLNRDLISNNLNALHAAMSVIGLMSFITLVPFSIPALNNFNSKNLLLLGYTLIWVVLHGAIVYLFIKRAANKIS